MKKMVLTVILMFTQTALWAFSPTQLAQNLQKPQNIQGQFVQQRFLKSLSKPMTTSGTFALMPQKGLLWQMQKPFDHTLRVRSDGIMQWNGKQWLNPQQNKMAQNQQIQLFLDLLGGNTQGLEKQFTLKLEGDEQQWTLQLTPKTAIMKQIFSQIIISGDEVVRQIELHEKQGDRTLMQFKQIQTNQHLSEFAKQHL